MGASSVFFNDMNKQEKKKFVEGLSKEIEAASTVALVDYAGLNVKMLQEIKRELKKVDTRVVIVKNTLFKIAGEKAKAPKEALQDSVLAGPTAMVITEGDPIAPLQILGKFAKANELPQFKVGIVEGTFQDKEGLTKLSKLPGKDALVGQAMGAIAAPLYGLVGTLNAPMQKLVHVLSEASKKSK